MVVNKTVLQNWYELLEAMQRDLLDHLARLILKDNRSTFPIVSMILSALQDLEETKRRLLLLKGIISLGEKDEAV